MLTDRGTLISDPPIQVGTILEQVAWLVARRRAGAGRCFILIRVGHGHLPGRGARVRGLLRGLVAITQDE